MNPLRGKVHITFAEVDEPPMLAPETTLRGPCWFWAAALGVIAIASIAPTLLGGFLPQDDANVTENIFLRSWPGLRGIWRFAYSDWFAQFSPLGYTMYLLEYHIWGNVAHHAASGYRCVNLALHICNALLLWTLLRKIAIPGAFVAAAIFAAHPVQGQTVAWISQQPMLWATMLTLMSAIVYLRFCGLNPAPYMPGPLHLPQNRAVLYVVSLGLFVLAVLFKPALAVLPLVILNLVWWERGQIAFSDLKPLIPFLAITLLSFAGAIVVFHHSSAIAQQQFGVVDRIGILGPALWFYAYELIRPGTFNFVYPRGQPTAWWAWLFLAAALATCLWFWRSRDRLGRGSLVAAKTFILLLLPSILFLDLEQSRESFIVDSAMYLACTAVIVPIVALIAEWFLDGKQMLASSPAPWIALGALVLAIAMSLHVASAYFSTETLWTKTLDRYPGSVYALDQLGMWELKRNQTNRAEELFRRALAVDPGNLRTHRDLGACFEAAKQPDRAYAEYLLVLRARPQDFVARCGLARALAAQGDPLAALKQYQIVLRNRPENPNALNGMAMLYVQLGEPARAVDCYQRSIRATPNDLASHINLANLYLQMHNNAAAVGELSEARHIDPHNYIVYINIGAMCGEFAQRAQDPSQKRDLVQKAEQAFREALFWNPDSAVAAFNLAKVLSFQAHQNPGEDGKMREAIFYFKKAAQLDPANTEYQVQLATARREVEHAQ